MQSSKRADAIKSWYSRNKERINSQKREKYRNDPEFRLAVLEKNKNSNSTKTQQEDISGCLTIKQVARMLKLDPLVVKQAEPLLPGPLLSDKNRHRVLTPEQTLVVMSLPKSTKAKTIEKQRVKVRIVDSQGIERLEEIYYISDVAHECARSIKSVRFMTDSGILPPSPFHLVRRHVYISDMVLDIKKLLRPLANRTIRKNQIGLKIFEDLHTSWVNKGYYNSKLIQE